MMFLVAAVVGDGLNPLLELHPSLALVVAVVLVAGIAVTGRRKHRLPREEPDYPEQQHFAIHLGQSSL